MAPYVINPMAVFEQAVNTALLEAAENKLISNEVAITIARRIVEIDMEMTVAVNVEVAALNLPKPTHPGTQVVQ